jgi:plastocyanin
MNTVLMRLLVCSLLAAALRSAAADAVIEGTVALPAPKVQPDTSARYHLKSGSVAQPEKPTAVVYLEGHFTPAPVQESKPVEINQRGCQFRPALLPVLKGTTVAFPNLDGDYHHVFSYSRPKEFDLGRYRKGENPPTVTFDKPGVVLIGCEIHDHMQAIVLVLETPYFGRTDFDGHYRLDLKGVPPGNYQLKAWAGLRDVREQNIEVKDGATLHVDFPAK